MKQLLLAALLFIANLLPLQAQKQEYVTQSFKLPPTTLSRVLFDGNNWKADNAKFSLTWICFDSGQRTCIVELDWPFFLNEMKKTKPYQKKVQFSWSGKDLRLVKQSDGKGNHGYIISKNGVELGGLVAVMVNGVSKWCFGYTTNKDTPAMTDIWTGMNIDEFKDITAAEVAGSSVKFLCKNGNMNVYQLLWLGESGTEQKRNLHLNKEWGRFWFDASGKLVKWYMNL
ncbi:MAG: hypothetical protein IJM04_01265 [Prevotella sp.]|nr:hypothetical protein [Prevotella sp.]